MDMEIQYFKSDRGIVNSFLAKISMILVMDKDKEFMDYLGENCGDFTDLIKYTQIISSGWIKPRFDAIKIILNAFDF